MNDADGNPVDTVLRDELARADRALGGVAPVLAHVLASSGHALVNDAIVARVRGMLSDMSVQLVNRLPDPVLERITEQDEPVDRLVERLANDTPTLAHVHAIAMEGVLTDRLDQRASIDPILSPLSQELIASHEETTAETAMLALAAQSRFMQAQRRMQYPVLELPAEALERVMRLWARSTPMEHEAAVTEAMRELKADYDEAQSRGGLIARLVASMRGGVVAALELEHAGLALFVSALAHRTGQSRDRAVLACHEMQAVRLAVSLRAAGLDATAIERQFLVLESQSNVPHQFVELTADAALAMLQDSEGFTYADGHR
ncbi:MAG: hypothetical protein QNI87_04630 [Erythrobacter sp.]|uniref:hypothetical protein n=1 Tax=Erythrobacter sp. TaxID=1042 RepID=UPI00260C1FA0|nr:hypothetical protein [Erythrobacter sp.]MDJ0977800.1 hypothetical protein [Erythrobacter sp.]